MSDASDPPLGLFDELRVMGFPESMLERFKDITSRMITPGQSVTQDEKNFHAAVILKALGPEATTEYLQRSANRQSAVVAEEAADYLAGPEEDE